MLKVEQGIVAPLRTDEETLGALAVISSALDEGDLPALAVFAAQVAISLHNVRLYQQAQQELAERRKAEAALLES
ncbi:MAG: hypothetical protein C0393_07930, partial [Anaerolinea sp.]|nr:hypothetical protein [Anaerolinea sp.]